MNFTSAKYYKQDGKNVTIKCVVENNGDMENSTDIWIPVNENNRHYQDIMKWVAEVDENGVSKGNTIEEAD